MMNSSQDNFDSIRQAYKSIFEALEIALNKLNIDFYLIGAQSRDVWTGHLTQVRRITRDVDFAVYIVNWKSWEDLTTYLESERKFTRDPTLPYRFYKDGQLLDLIPFGAIEINGEVVIGNPQVRLSVYGCGEVTESAIIFNKNYKVISLSGLCVMKLIAYGENPINAKRTGMIFCLF